MSNKKPTGITGPARLSNVGGGAVAEFRQLKFPADKEGVEKLVAEGFLASIAAAKSPTGQVLVMDGLKQNAQDDFDFSVMTAEGPAYLELMESAPLTGPYEKAPAVYKPYEYAQRILAEIGEKAASYPRVGVRGIYLLIYITHWTFILSESTLNCLRYWLASLPSPFVAVFLYMPITEKEGITEWLSPADPPAGFHPDQVIGATVTNLDSRNFQPTISDDGAATFMLTVNPDCEKP